MPTYDSGIDFTPLIQGVAEAFQLHQQKLDNQNRQQELALQQQQAPIQAALTQSEIAKNYAGIGENPQGQPLPRPNYIPLPDKPNKGESQSDFYNRRYLVAAQNLHTAYQQNDTNGQGEWYQAAQNEMNQGYKYTNEAYTAGPRTQQTEATTAEIKAKTHNLAGQFEHDIDMLKLRGANAAQVAHIHAAYRRAGGGSASSSAAEQRAMIAAMNEAERQHVQIQNSELERTYYTQQALHDADPDNNPAPQQPQFKIAPIVVPGQNGQPVIIQLPNAQQQQPAPATKPQTQAPAASAKPQGPGIVQQIENGIGGLVHSLFGGGGGGGQHLTAKNRAGQPIHSDDGGKTWQPGP